jgi:hypothetical protein
MPKNYGQIFEEYIALFRDYQEVCRTLKDRRLGKASRAELSRRQEELKKDCLEKITLMENLMGKGMESRWNEQKGKYPDRRE